jgi:hypothetical protein
MKLILFPTLFALLAMAIGFGLGMVVQEECYHREAIQRGYAHYELNNLTGKTTWTWNK